MEQCQLKGHNLARFQRVDPGKLSSKVELLIGCTVKILKCLLTKIIKKIHLARVSIQWCIC